MAISNVNTQPSVHAVVGNASAPFANDAKRGDSQDVATVVTLSAQGQKLSQSQASQNKVNQNNASNGVNTTPSVNVGPKSTATVAAPGIQFVSGESKGGRVNTYA